MAHYTSIIDITSTWQDLYDLCTVMADQLNIQNQTGARVAFCIHDEAPTANSYTIAENLDIVVKPAAIAHLWVRSMDRLNGKLSIEVV